MFAAPWLSFLLPHMLEMVGRAQIVESFERLLLHIRNQFAKIWKSISTSDFQSPDLFQFK